MKRHPFPLCLAFIAAALPLLLFWRGALCAPDLRGNPGGIVIEGPDHETLRAGFSRMEQGRATRPLGDEVAQVLFRVLPDSCKTACEEQVDRLGEGAAGTAGMTVNLLDVEAGKEDKPIRALVTIVCSSRDEAFAGAFRKERLAVLVISHNSSHLTFLPPDTAEERSPGSVRIAFEKEVRINGHCVVGLVFARSNSDPSGGDAVGILRDEWIQFYVFGDDAIRPAGSVQTGREERLLDGEGRQTRSVYNAAMVFKKDMKGNIIGILSPFTLKKDNKRIGRGMVRYGWDDGKQAFVKE